MTAGLLRGVDPAFPAATVVVPTRDRPGPLAACLAALEAQTVRSFEIVVVDDRSRDPSTVAAVVAGVSGARLVHGDGRGPAAARNVGAAAARGPVVCFTDDDCRPGSRWLQTVLDRVRAGAHIVAGPTRNGRPWDRWATASQTVTNHLTEATYEPGTGQVGFAPTSNLAVVADVQRRLPFDETYPLAAGEDREWCSRATAEGMAIAFEPAAWVEHHQNLSLRTFWRQQVRYGRGAHRWRRGRDGPRRLQPARFYVDLVRAGLSQGAGVGLLVALSQVATAVGVAQEAIAVRRRADRRGGIRR